MENTPALNTRSQVNQRKLIAPADSEITLPGDRADWESTRFENSQEDETTNVESENDPEDRRRATEELWKAAAEGVDDRAVEAAVEAGADVRARNVHGETPLHWAAERGREASVLSLISHGAELEAKGSDGWTPLHCAAYSGHLPCTKLLVERGADPNARDSDGRTPLAIAVQHNHHTVQQYLESVGGTS